MLDTLAALRNDTSTGQAQLDGIEIKTGCAENAENLAFNSQQLSGCFKEIATFAASVSASRLARPSDSFQAIRSPRITMVSLLHGLMPFDSWTHIRALRRIPRSNV
eukprot:TRINITY_DN31231_c0_g1_i1.p2 TRINITY_DN31231_c0_g1~~TRINITY_DN31231_c0_g1_i1.p2  ORF type:complete len:106 (-),score=13.31 TRINITY_DN31231_c0_g1_i1:275-592(-)